MIKPIKTRHSSLETEPETEEMEPLSPVARMFHEPHLNCYIIIKIGVKNSVDADIFKKMVIATFMKHPRFFSKLVFDPMGTGRPVGWTHTTVNADDHIIVPNLDANMNEPDKFVEDYVSNISKLNPIMDLSRPLWEFHILNVKTSDCASIVIMRLHHSLGDGVSISSLVIACCGRTSDRHGLPLLRITKKKKQRVNINTSSSRSLRYHLVFLKVWFNTFVDVVMFVATLIFLKDTNTPLKGEPNIGRTPTPTRFVHRHLSLDDIKFVKNETNTTMNDVVLGITQAGLSRYLRRSYGTGEDGMDPMLKHIRLRAAVMKNLRPTTIIEDLAKLIKVGGGSKGHLWGNSFAFIIFPLLVSLKDDPLDYIRSAKATMERKKQSSEASVAYSVASLVLNTMGVEAASCLTYKALVNTSVCFSNVAGPSEEMSLAGSPVAFFAPTSYGLPIALMIHFLSYMDKMITLSIGVDDGIIPNPHKLCDDIAKSLELSKNALSLRSTASKL